MRKLVLAAAAAALVGLFAGSAMAAPADKIGVNAGAVEAFECDAGSDPGPDPANGIPCLDTDDGNVIDATGLGAVVLPAIAYKGSTTADLLLQFTTECTLFNYVKRNSEETAVSTSDAGVVIWIELDDDAKAVGSAAAVAANSDIYEADETDGDPHVVVVSPRDAAGSAPSPNGEVTFCRRVVELELDEIAAIDGTLQVALSIASMSANAFNWIMQNPSAVILDDGGDGVQLGNNYFIRVMGRIELASSHDGVSGAGFRQRTLIVEPVHLARDTTF